MQNKFGLLVLGLVAGLAMGAGGSFGWMALTAPPPEVPVEETVVKPERIVKVVDEQALYEAKRQIEELKRQLAEGGKAASGREPKEPKIVKTEGTELNDVADKVRDLVKSALTPEQQAEIAAQRESFRQQMQQRVTARTDFLASVDTRHMNAAQRANHDKLVAASSRMSELTAAMMDAKGEMSSEARKEMHDLGHSMEELYQEERKTLLESTGKSLGYTGDQAQQFADQIQSIYDNTSSRSMWGGGFSGRRGNNAPSANRK